MTSPIPINSAVLHNGLTATLITLPIPRSPSGECTILYPNRRAVSVPFAELTIVKETGRPSSEPVSI